MSPGGKEIKIVLTGNPISTNSIYRAGCVGNKPHLYLAPSGKSRKTEYQWQVKTQYKDRPLHGSLAMEVKLYFVDRREHDWDNYHKLSQDSLEGMVFENDNQIKRCLVEKFYDPNNPRTEITISTINPN